jgi:hypothetical protein
VQVQLVLAGLGEKILDLNSDEMCLPEIKPYVEALFPKLKAAGGFRLLTLDSATKALAPIPLTATLSAGGLKAIQRRGRIYVQPLQRNLFK